MSKSTPSWTNILAANWIRISVILGYYLFGIAFGAFGMGLGIVHSIYFTTVTWSTVGYGDIAEKTTGTKLLGILFIITGLSLVAEVAGTFAHKLNEKLDERVRKELDSQDISPMTKVLRPLFAWGALWMLTIGFGTLFFCLLEDWPLIDGLWWSVVTATTVGYGDLEIRSQSYLFDTVFIFWSVWVTGQFLGNITSVSVFLLKRDIARRRDRETPTDASLDAMLAHMKTIQTGQRGLSDGEFLMHHLAGLGLVSKAHCSRILKLHKKIGSGGDGVVSEADIQSYRQALGTDTSQQATSNGRETAAKASYLQQFQQQPVHAPEPQHYRQHNEDGTGGRLNMNSWI